MKQDMNAYTQEDFLVWKTLFDRQLENLKDKGSRHYLIALQQMQAVLNRHVIPDFRAINGYFNETTGWSIEIVPGLIPVEEFFELLAQKKFCSSTWLRGMKNLDYLEEPDMFHDVFGHIPLLNNPIFSAFAHEFGKLGRTFIGNDQALLQLQRLYWFTIEFGVIREAGKIKSYGAGIMSSYGETNRIAKQNCTFSEFDIEKVLNKEFWTDRLQDEYVVIENLDQLFNSLDEAAQIIQPIKIKC